MRNGRSPYLRRQQASFYFHRLKTDGWGTWGRGIVYNFLDQFQWNKCKCYDRTKKKKQEKDQRKSQFEKKNPKTKNKPDEKPVPKLWIIHKNPVRGFWAFVLDLHHLYFLNSAIIFTLRSEYLELPEQISNDDNDGSTTYEKGVKLPCFRIFSENVYSKRQ